MQLKKELAQDEEPERNSISIAIDIGNGKDEIIEVKKGDNPDLLASAFSIKHGFNERKKAKLAKIIEKNILEAFSDDRILYL